MEALRGEVVCFFEFRILFITCSLFMFWDWDCAMMRRSAEDLNWSRSYSGSFSCLVVWV